MCSLWEVYFLVAGKESGSRALEAGASMSRIRLIECTQI